MKLNVAWKAENGEPLELLYCHNGSHFSGAWQPSAPAASLPRLLGHWPSHHGAGDTHRAGAAGGAGTVGAGRTVDAAPGTEAAVETGAGHTEVAVGQTEAGVEGRASAVAVGGRIAVARGVGAADAGGAWHGLVQLQPLYHVHEAEHVVALLV